MAGNQLIGMGRRPAPVRDPGAGDRRAVVNGQCVLLHDVDDGRIFLIISPAVSQSLFAEGAHNPARCTPRPARPSGAISIMLAPCIVGVFVIGGTLLSAFGTAYEHHAIGLLRSS